MTAASVASTSGAAASLPTWVPTTATAFGGVVLGALLTTWREWMTERRRTDREFDAAALVVSDEIRANVVKLEIALQTSEDPEPLANQTYQSCQLILLRRLSSEARDAVRGAYIHAQVHRAFQVRQQGQWVRSTPVVQEALDKAKRAQELLRPYLPNDAAAI